MGPFNFKEALAVMALWIGTCLAWVAAAALVVALMGGCFAAVPALLVWAWNTVAPTFGGPVLTFWQGVAVVVLLMICFGGLKIEVNRS